MKISHSNLYFSVIGALWAIALLSIDANSASAQLVPGTGQKVEDIGDDFEDEVWQFVHNFPKSSRNIDHRERQPTGYSGNARWLESAKRGQPDVIKRVNTPSGGLPGSKGALLLQSLHTGVPGRPSRESQQDDLLLQGRYLSVTYSPSILVRVFLPPFEEWEDSTDTSFGLRASLTGPGPKREKEGDSRKRRGLFGFLRTSSSRNKTAIETFYPGMFIQFNSKTDGEHEKDSAYFIIRGNEFGQDFVGPEIAKTGWWTLGMSFTPDGRVHYYASPGVDDLKPSDRIASHFCQKYRANHFNSFFFNVVSKNNGGSWSTRWIIDDPSLHYVAR